MELRKDLIGLMIGVIVVAVGIALYIGGAFKKGVEAPLSGLEGGATSSAGTVPPMTVSVGSLSAGDAGKRITPPQDTYKDPSGKGPSVLSYNLTAQSGAYSPNELIIAKGERVQINLKAVDADYDLQIAPPIGLYVIAKKGEVASFGFDAAKAGRYEFACSKMCPSGSQMRGAIVIK